MPEAKRAKAFISLFLDLGIWVTEYFFNYSRELFTFLRYLAIRTSLARNAPIT